MQLKQLSNFISIADNGSFNGAAKELFMSQSSLSSSIANLEEDLGFALFERAHNGVVLTPMGRTVYNDAKMILEQIDEKEKSWKEAYQKRLSCSTTINVAVAPGVYPIFSTVIKQFKQSYPNVKIRISERRNRYLLNSLIEGKADFIVNSFSAISVNDITSVLNDQIFYVETLRNDSFKLAVNADNPLANADTLSVSDINGASLACYADGDDAADEYFARGFDKEKSLEFNSIEKIIDAAINGEAIGCLPEYTITKALPILGLNHKLVFKTLNGYSVPLIHYIAYKKKTEFNLLAEELRQFTINAFSADDPS